MAGDWGFGFLYKVMENANAPTTVFGMMWMTVLFMLRIAVLGFAADGVWNDERSAFECNTVLHGCEKRCFFEAYPISPIRLWTVQLIFVAVPTLFYLGLVMGITNEENKMREELRKKQEKHREAQETLREAHAVRKLREKEERLRRQLANQSPPEGTREEKREQLIDLQGEIELREQLAKPPGGTENNRRPRFTDEKGNVKIKGMLLSTYLITLLLKILVEAASIFIQYELYEFKVEYVYECNTPQVPNHHCQKPMDCWNPRPLEKTSSLWYMLAVASLSVLLNVVEMLYLLGKMKYWSRICSDDVEAVKTPEETPDSQPGSKAPSYNSAMMGNMEVTLRQNNDVMVQMESVQRRSFSGRLNGDDGGAAAPSLTRLTTTPPNVLLRNHRTATRLLLPPLKP